LTGRQIAATYAPTRVGDVRDSQADITAAREVLGFTPTVTFEDGLAKTLAWSRQDAGRA
jgi:UDP-glucose 4-epimerase